jgi:hypothetical protein
MMMKNRDKDLQNKLFKLQHLCKATKQTLTNKARKDSQLKLYEVMAAPVLLYGCENCLLSRVDKRGLKRIKWNFEEKLLVRFY